jgi:FKBP-type peptidyl-prolyl cis-trans isomerase
LERAVSEGGGEMRKLAIVLLPVLVLVLVIGAVGCGGGESKGSAVIGDTVKVHYTGRLGNGTIFDSSVEREPLQFTLGQGQVIRGFEQAVLGMTVGESKAVVIPADEAYGPYRDELVIVTNRSDFPPGWEPEIGD